MAASDVSICNAALILVGASRITSLSEDSEAARLCNQLFDDLREQVLCHTEWNFAAARAALAQLSEAPAHGYAYQYELPADCLRVRREINEADFRIEGRALLTDAGTVEIVYTRRVTDMALLPPDCRAGLELSLAAALAVPLAGSRAMAESLAQRAERALARAAARDAQQGTPIAQAEGDWVTGRW